MRDKHEQVALDRMARNVTRLLAKRRLSVYALAKAVDRPRSTIHAIVSGKCAPSAVLLLRISKVLGVTMDSLFSTKGNA